MRQWRELNGAGAMDGGVVEGYGMRERKTGSWRYFCWDIYSAIWNMKVANDQDKARSHAGVCVSSIPL